MHKAYKIGIGIFIFLILALVFLDATEPEPVNLTPSYSEDHKIPLGSYAAFQSWRKTREIEQVRIPPFEILSKEENPDGIYFFLNNKIAFDESELNQLLDWTSRGNTIFISAGDISENLLDTLNLRSRTYFNDLEFKFRPKVKLEEKASATKEDYQFNFDFQASFFSISDSLEHRVLGTVVFENDTPDEKVNFVKTDFGEGEIFLHSTPEVFSNYFLLQDENYRYAEKALSYLNPAKPVLWDSYYKTGKNYYSSPLYYLLGNRSLKWAYYFMLLAGLLFIIFEGKRRQRPIPVVKPLKNRSFDFTKTISLLYLEQKKYKELTRKKIELFLEFIRERFRFPTGEINENFIKNLAGRSGNTKAFTGELFEKIQQLQDQEEISKDEFTDLARKIEKFKNTKNGTTGNKS